MEKKYGSPTSQKRFPFVVVAEMATKDVVGRIGWFDGGVEQLHTGVFQAASAFAVVAGRTSRYDIPPDVLSAEMARQNVIDGQIGGVFSTVLAGETVAAENFTACEFELRTGARDHLLKANDGWTGEDEVDRVNFSAPIQYQSGFFAQEKPQRSPGIADIDRFEVGIQNKNRGLHRVSPMVRL
jgi:hypothetical protein